MVEVLLQHEATAYLTDKLKEGLVITQHSAEIHVHK